MIEEVNSAIRSRAAALRQEFESAAPFHHLVFDDFLDTDFCRALVSSFPEFDGDRARNELGDVGRKAVHPNLSQLGPAYVRFDQLMQLAEFLRFMALITGIPDLRYDPQYIGGARMRI